MVLLRDYLQLIRLPVSLAVTFSAFVAGVMAPAGLSAALIWPVIGIFMLAAGASALNQYQEWPYDEKMERTRNRPLPSRRMDTAQVLRVANIFIIGGFIVLIWQGQLACFFLGLLNLLWYNGLYTILKRRTAFAVVPGALTGVIPVLMGWSAGKGELWAPEPLFLAFFIFIWQMPHFWLIMLKYGDDYRKAGFPVLNDLLTKKKMKRIIMAWMTAASAASILIVYHRITTSEAIQTAILILNLITLLIIVYQLFISSAENYRVLFISGNIFMAGVLGLILADKLLV